MIIAGEASGDQLAAELVVALRATPELRAQPFPAKFFGAGGSRMADAGVELAFDLTQHAVIGISDVVKNYFKFRRLFHRLLKLAMERQPDVIVCVDFSEFNLNFAHAVKNLVRGQRGHFSNWNPKIVRYVSPQVWASRPGRAAKLAADHDLLLSIFPFEREWFAARTPKLRVEFVGHPMVGRYRSMRAPMLPPVLDAHTLVLLPGSRKSELQKHLPAMLGAVKILRTNFPKLKTKMVLTNTALAAQARELGVGKELEIQIGNLPAALLEADVALASTGTVTMECAFFGVPTVAFYKTSWLTYRIAKWLVTVKHLAMPNILAGEEIYPELVQKKFTAENLAARTAELLRDEPRRLQIKTKLEAIVATLGEPGANHRAARAVVSLLR
jgi:lipid-A-disaccharide synthase